jgi:hypothetical protein
VTARGMLEHLDDYKDNGNPSVFHEITFERADVR